MQFDKLRYFKVVAEELSLTRAAEKLRITQQAVSNAIGKLEREYHATFFERKKPRLVLTPEGQHFYAFVSSVLARESRVAGELGEIRLNHAGQLRLGTTLTRSMTFLPEALTLFATKNPRIRLNMFVRAHRFELERKLVENELDLIVSPVETSLPSSIRVVTLERSYFCLTLPRTAIESILPPEQSVAEFAALPLAAQRVRILASGLLTRLPYVYGGAKASYLAPRFMARFAPGNPAVLNFGDDENLISLPYCKHTAVFIYDTLAGLNQATNDGVPDHFIYPVDTPDAPYTVSLCYSSESRNPALPLIVRTLVDLAKQRRAPQPKEFFATLNDI